MVQTGAQLGPYRLLRRIGAGGMAEVFLGQRIGAEGFARTVAIKTILAIGAEEEGIGLFLDEARVAAYLEHAAIVQTLDLGFENDTLFIVMEYVPGPALSRIIRDFKKSNRFLSPAVVAYVGARVASALDYAHRRATTPDGKLLKLVHRDISPQNIMLTRGGMVKLTDFGVARASVQTHRTRTGQVRGKAAYMAPEQVRAGQLDGRTDVFALGLVLYEALTAIRAYQRKTDIMSMRAILTDELAPIKDANPSVPDELVEVVGRALSKKPEQRFQSAQEMADALARTYKQRSEASIEGEIVAVINELFGPEQYTKDENNTPVEAWQPTITAQAEGDGGSHPTPHRITGSKLSPKIAALLRKDEPPLPDESTEEPSIDVSTPSVDGTGIAAGLGSPAAVPPRNAAVPTASFGSLPGAPVMGQTDARAAMLRAGTLSADPLAFSEMVPSQPGTTSHSLSGVSSLVFTNPNARGVGRRAIWALVGVAGLVIAVLGFLIFQKANGRNPDSGITGVATEGTAPPVEARATEAGPARIEAHAQSAKAIAPPQDLAPTAKDAEPKRVAETKHAKRRLDHAKLDTKSEAATALPVDPPKRVEPEKPASQEKARLAFVAHANELKNHLKDSPNEADRALARQIERIQNDVLMFQHEISPEDRDLIRRAEAQLKR
jgi:serine/threonine protein kinase